MALVEVSNDVQLSEWTQLRWLPMVRLPVKDNVICTRSFFDFGQDYVRRLFSVPNNLRADGNYHGQLHDAVLPTRTVIPLRRLSGQCSYWASGPHQTGGQEPPSASSVPHRND